MFVFFSLTDYHEFLFNQLLMGLEFISVGIHVQGAQTFLCRSFLGSFVFLLFLGC